MNLANFKDLLKNEVKGLTDYLAEVDYSNAISAAQRDTGWSLPVTDDFKIQWTLNRSRRWLLYYLWTESASQFQVEQIHLEHQFEQYGKLIEIMDADFETVQEERPDMFASVETFHLFGTKVDAGFAYNSLTGRDETYLSDNKVDFEPKENS